MFKIRVQAHTQLRLLPVFNWVFSLLWTNFLFVCVAEFLQLMICVILTFQLIWWFHRTADLQTLFVVVGTQLSPLTAQCVACNLYVGTLMKCLNFFVIFITNFVRAGGLLWVNRKLPRAFEKYSGSRDIFRCRLITAEFKVLAIVFSRFFSKAHRF